MTSAVIKHKSIEEDGSAVASGSTVFVSNLPYSATTTDLQTLFSDVGPVRSAFVVLEQGSRVSKGVGYVTFAIKADVQAAIEQACSEGITLDGRKLRVELAENKRKEKQDSLDKVASTRPPPTHARPVHDPLTLRTVVITGLPTSINPKALYKKLRKLEGFRSHEWPMKTETNEDHTTAHALFETPASAAKAVSKLHAHIFKGSLISATLKRQLDTLVKIRNPANKAASPSRVSRLIVRNLPWDATEQDLRALFLPFGPVHSIHIPTSDGEAKGFAFVWMLRKSDAEKAILGCNGKHVRAGLVQELVEDKQKRKKQRRVEKKLNGPEDTKEMETSAPGKARTIAVDWALSKQKWIEEKAGMPDEGDEGLDNTPSDEEPTDEEIHSDHDGGSCSSQDVTSSEVGSADEINATDAEDDRESGQSPVAPQLPAPETGTTLFIRNVPFEATEDELRSLFRVFGPLRYARITVDPETGRSRGTGFACFWNKLDADKAMEQSELLQSETTGGDMHANKRTTTHPSILTPDPSSSLARMLVLHGRTLDVTRAVTRDEAQRLKVEGEKKRQRADKRNMYLLAEGVITPNTPAAEGLNDADIERRTSSYNSRRSLLRSNPALYVSKTRLSIRQIPLLVTERVLKRLAMRAVDAFEDEVKEGIRDALAEDELEATEDEDEQAKGGRRKTKRLPKTSKVKQVKIVRQDERVDVITKKGRSKGYGFVEMYNHADALRLLRWANGNPNLGPLFATWRREELEELLKAEKGLPESKRDEARIERIKREQQGNESDKMKGTLMIEFSIENAQVVRRRNLREPRPDAAHVPAADTSAQRATKRRQRAHSAEPAQKKRRLVAKTEQAKQTRDSRIKEGQRIGHMIGRKRKKQKMARK